MEYQFTSEQDELRASLRRLLVERANPRAAYDGGPAVDRELWAMLADAGALGLGIDEAHGGSGGGLIDQVVVAEELGRAVAPVPFLATTVMGGFLVGALGSADQTAEIGAAIASGALVVAVALTGPGTGNTPGEVRCADGRLTGRLPLVVEGAAADLVLVPVVEGDGQSVYAVRTATTGASVEDLPALDRTRRPAEVVLEAAEAERLGAVGGADDALDDARRRAYVALAADATGAAGRSLELSADYAKVRQQFGQPIGVFQAVKHKAAEMLVAVENARSATYFGAWEVEAGTTHADVAAATAKATATEHAVTVVGDAVQIHGGIAITWEHDLHLYLRRVKVDELLLGDPESHLERVATHVLGQ